MTSDRVGSLLYYAAALAGYALLAVALVLAAVLVMKRGRDEPPSSAEHRAWITETLATAAAERREPLPPQMKLFVERYLQEPRVLICPSAEKEFDEEYWPVGREPDARDVSYCYVNGLSEMDGHDYAIAFDEEWNHDHAGVNVLYIGGHVEWKGNLDDFQVEAAVQLLGMQGRGALGSNAPLLHRPWWSRYPEPPAFQVPPPETGDGSFLMGASRLSLVIGAALALVGVYLLRRIGR